MVSTGLQNTVPDRHRRDQPKLSPPIDPIKKYRPLLFPSIDPVNVLHRPELPRGIEPKLGNPRKPIIVSGVGTKQPENRMENKTNIYIYKYI